MEKNDERSASTEKPIKVSGHLQDFRGIYQMKLSWYDHNGERGRKSISTGLPIKRTKKRTEDMLKAARREQEAILAQRTNSHDLLFKGFIRYSIMDRVRRPKPERFVGKFLKQSEVVELLETVKRYKLELSVILGAFYGLRHTEIVGLR